MGKTPSWHCSLLLVASAVTGSLHQLVQKEVEKSDWLWKKQIKRGHSVWHFQRLWPWQLVSSSSSSSPPQSHPPAGEGPGVGESAGERAPAAGRAEEEALRHCRGSSGSAVRGQRRRPREAQSFHHVAQTQQTSAHEETSAGTEAHPGAQSRGKKMFQSGVWNTGGSGGRRRNAP